MSLDDAKRDPWFWVCASEAADTPELVENFLRLNGYSMPKSRLDSMIDEATGALSAQAKDFLQFVFDCVYTRVPRPA